MHLHVYGIDWGSPNDFTTHESKGKERSRPSAGASEGRGVWHEDRDASRFRRYIPQDLLRGEEGPVARPRTAKICIHTFGTWNEVQDGHEVQASQKRRRVSYCIQVHPSRSVLSRTTHQHTFALPWDDGIPRMISVPLLEKGELGSDPNGIHRKRRKKKAYTDDWKMLRALARTTARAARRPTVSAEEESLSRSGIGSIDAHASVMSTFGARGFTTGTLNPTQGEQHVISIVQRG